MSALQLLVLLIGIWAVFVTYRWRSDVLHQQRNRVRDVGRKAAGKLPPHQPGWRKIILGCLWLGVVYYLLPDPGAYVLAVSPLVLLLFLSAVQQWCANHGHYQAALRVEGLLLLVAPDSPALRLRRAELLCAGGRIEEAFEVLKGAFAQMNSQGHEVRALFCLGRVYTAQGHHEEAARAIETALKISPRRSLYHAALAESYLWRADKLEEALVIATRALDYESKTRRKSGPNSFAEIWSVRAWLFALLGRRDAMLQAIRQALECADESQRLEVAGVHFRLGMALRAAGQEPEAVKFFEDARATDPAGYYGKLAVRALEGAPASPSSHEPLPGV